MSIGPSTKVLKRVLVNNISLTAALNDIETTPLQRALCYDVLRWHLQIDYVLNKLLLKPIKEKNFVIKAVLYIGILQILHEKRSDHATVNELVQYVKKSNFRFAASLVNKILRQCCEHKAGFLKSIEKNKVARYSHPQWMLDLTQNIAVLEANNKQAPMTLRVNLRKTSRQKYLQQLESQQIHAKVLDSSNSAIQLEKPLPVAKLPGFNEGWCSIQDEAGQRVVKHLQLDQENLRILDACAAPGSKTCHILEAALKPAAVIACDIDTDRLKKVEENIQRLKLSAEPCELITADATSAITWEKLAPFDRILIDAPCSGSGVIRRHPDIKHLRRESDLIQLQLQQRSLVDSLVPMLNSGAILVYSTCSIFNIENDDMLTYVAETHPSLSLKHTEQFWPIENGQDGFFIACFQKH